MNYTSLLVYLDDIILFGSTVEETLSRLSEFFEILKTNNLKLKPKKCSYFQKDATFLGHKVSETGISPAVIK